MTTPSEKTIILTFYSHPTKDLKMRWKATLTFHPDSSDESMAEFNMADGEGTPVAEGSFEFAGITTPIRDGKGWIKCGDFVRGKHEKAIWLHRKGMLPIPGALTFE